MSENIVYINDTYIPENKATVSIFDRGFLFADGIYEVIPVYEGKVIFLDEHLNRLQQNLNQLKINYQIDKKKWQAVCAQLITYNGENKPIYIQITRGRDKTRLHTYPDNLVPTVIALSLSAIKLGGCLNENTVKAITLDDIRWQLCNIKSIALLGNILLNQQAYEQGANEALLVNKDGYVVEGSSSNFFIVKNKHVYTSKLNNEILPGITRKIVIDILNQHGIPFTEKNITKDELYACDELWLTSSTREIRTVTNIDGHIINTNEPNGLWRQVVTWYIEYIKHLIN